MSLIDHIISIDTIENDARESEFGAMSSVDVYSCIYSASTMEAH